MANVALSIEEEDLNKARIHAIEQGCRSSISICVKEHEHESGDKERKLIHAASRQAYR